MFHITYIQRVRVYVTVSHYIYSASRSVCYCFELHIFSLSECMLLFHVTALSVSEYVLLFPITDIERVRVYVTVFHYRH